MIRLSHSKFPNIGNSPIIGIRNNSPFSEIINIITDNEIVSRVSVTKIQEVFGFNTEKDSPIALESYSDYLSPDSGITISSTNSTITFSGRYKNAYKDIIQTLPSGRSDKSVTPTISKNFDSIPVGHTIFSAIQEDKVDAGITYAITIKHDGGVHKEYINHPVGPDITLFQKKLKELYPSP